MDATNPYAPPTAELEDRGDLHDNQAPFYAVSIPKMVTLHVATFGLYLPYWHYRQWREVRRSQGEACWPIVRAIFAPLWGFELYPRIHKAATAERIQVPWKSWAPPTAALCINAVGWALTFSQVNGIPFDFLWLLDILPPLFAQRTLQRLHAVVAPGARRNTRFTLWNILWLLLGALLWLGVLITKIQPPPGS
jgi:hypothetical protein